MKPINQYEHKGYTINVHQDEDPMNPRTEFDNGATMALFHKRYTLGDKNLGFDDGDFEGWDDMEKGIRKRFDIVAITPVYMYDHSGITIQTRPFSCPWDSGQIGFAYITREQAASHWGWNRITKSRFAKLHAGLEAEVEEYDQYLTDEVYGYTVTDPEGNDADISCWGFYGDDGLKYGIEEAKAEIDSAIAYSIKMAKPENNKNQQTLGLEGIK